jgi:hypothetical protein
MEQGVHLAQAMATLVVFLVMGLPMQMEVVAAVALEEVSAMVRGVVPAQEVGKARVITADHMVTATQTAVAAEVEAVVAATVGLAMVLVVVQVAVMALHGTTVMVHGSGTVAMAVTTDILKMSFIWNNVSLQGDTHIYSRSIMFELMFFSNKPCLFC